MELKILGHTKIHFLLNETDEFFDNFLVAAALSHTIILGNPWLNKYKVLLDFSRQCLHAGRTQRRTYFWARATHTRSQTTNTDIHIENNFPEKYHERLAEILKQFYNIFAGEHSTTTGATSHCLHLVPHAKPFRCPPYRYPTNKKETIAREVEKILQDGVIEHSTSNYSSPIVLVKKKDGSTRFCVDYRKLNAQTKDETSVLPVIPEALRDLSQAKVFSVLDLKSGYWQIPMAPESKYLTAFTTPDGATYQFKVMPFGLKNAPSTFQNLMVQEVLPGYLRKFAMVTLMT